MELFIQDSQAVVIEHNGKSVVFDISSYDRKTIAETPTLFREVNNYIKHLSIETQNNLFQCYEEIKETLEDTFNVTMLNDDLRKIITKMYSILDYDDFLEYTKKCVSIGESRPDSSNAILLPPNPQLELGETDRKELTYLKHQTIELLAYAIYLRFMLPVWGTYMSEVSSQIGNRYKEYYAFSLMRNTQAPELDAFYKIRDYTDFLLEPELNMVCAVYDGIGSEDIINLIVTQAIVRRVSLNVISTNELPSFIVSYIYNFIKTVPKSINRVLGGQVRDNKSTFKDENNDSVLDVLRARDAVPPGEMKLQETAFWDVVEAAKWICPEIDENMVLKFKEAMDANTNFSREEAQFTLTMLIVNSIVNGPCLDYIDFDKYYRNAVVVAQSVIYHLGYPVIAALMSAVRTSQEPPLLNGSITRLSKEANLAILEKYSNYRFDIKDEYEKKVNKGIVKEIEAIVDEYLTCIWEPHVPDIEPYTNSNSAYITIPSDIRIQVAQLICDAS